MSQTDAVDTIADILSESTGVASASAPPSYGRDLDNNANDDVIGPGQSMQYTTETFTNLDSRASAPLAQLQQLAMEPGSSRV